MKKEYCFDSCGSGKIHVSCWKPEKDLCGIVQIVHGIAEHGNRYDNFAEYLNSFGFLVVAEDHMGHGKSIGAENPAGCFTGGWFSVVSDSYRLLTDTKAEYPELPYILLGHSMGSFIVRTILQLHPDSGIRGCAICGTGWNPAFLLQMGRGLARLACSLNGEYTPCAWLQNIVFGGFNKRISPRRTPFDWLCRDPLVVDVYMADPLCGFVASAGLLRDMLDGMLFIQHDKNLKKMNKNLPVYFISGDEDPVGNYGAGVRKTAEKFQTAGVQNITVRLYPKCRHELLNELNKQEIYGDFVSWIHSI